MERYTVAQAKALGLTHFECKYPCGVCYGRQRRIAGGRSFCCGCEAIGPGLSPGKVRASVNKHNRAVEKKSRQVWGIPVVFSGMNTGTR